MSSLQAEQLEALLEGVAAHSKNAITAIAARGALTESSVKILMCCFNEADIQACVEAVRANSEVLAYQGFDPAVTLKILLEKHEVAARKPAAPGLGIDYTDFNCVMRYCIAIFLTRGTDWGNIKKKSTPELQKIMDHLANNYAIRITNPKEKTAPEPKVITLSRVAASLPHITVTLNESGVGRTLLPKDNYSQECCSVPMLHHCSTLNLRRTLLAGLRIT